MSEPRLWAYVISWTGYEDKARVIAAALEPHVDRVAVIYSNAAETPSDGPGDWIQVPNSEFYGGKFAAALADFDGDVMLQIAADASTDDWGALARRCRQVFGARPGLAVWTPHIDWTIFTLESTELAEEGDGLFQVAATDSIVWALSAEVCRWFARLDVAANHYGWYLDEAASAHAHVGGRDVLLDTTVKVSHPRGSNYDSARARREGAAFVRRILTPAELRVHEISLALRYVRHRRTADPLVRARRLMRKLFGR